MTIKEGLMEAARAADELIDGESLARVESGPEGLGVSLIAGKEVADTLSLSDGVAVSLTREAEETLIISLSLAEAIKLSEPEDDSLSLIEKDFATFSLIVDAGDVNLAVEERNSELSLSLKVGVAEPLTLALEEG